MDRPIRKNPSAQDGVTADHVVLEARDVSKRFGHVVALERVSLRVRAGRVTCLLGDNGAGKSTLIRVLSGVFPPNSGVLLFEGKLVSLPSPRFAQAIGIATVHQDLAVIPLMSIWRNFYLGHEPTAGKWPFRRIQARRCAQESASALREFGIDIADTSRPAGTLSGGERQAVAIARSMHLGARVIILDEPTAALGVRQTAIVLDNIRRARDSGAGILLVTHNPAHAYQAGDEFVVLRGGRTIAQRAKGETSAPELADLMMGTAGS